MAVTCEEDSHTGEEEKQKGTREMKNRLPGNGVNAIPLVYNQENGTCTRQEGSFTGFKNREATLFAVTYSVPFPEDALTAAPRRPPLQDIFSPFVFC